VSNVNSRVSRFYGEVEKSIFVRQDKYFLIVGAEPGDK
jgi:hypothetical protein